MPRWAVVNFVHVVNLEEIEILTSWRENILSIGAKRAKDIPLNFIAMMQFNM